MGRNRPKPRQPQPPVAPSDQDVEACVPDVTWVSLKEVVDPTKAVIGVDAPTHFIHDMVSDITWDKTGVDKAIRRAIAQAIGMQCIPHHIMAREFREHISDWCKRIVSHLYNVTKPDITSIFGKLKDCIKSINVLGKTTDRVGELGSSLDTLDTRVGKLEHALGSGAIPELGDLRGRVSCLEKRKLDARMRVWKLNSSKSHS